MRGCAEQESADAGLGAARKAAAILTLNRFRGSRPCSTVTPQAAVTMGTSKARDGNGAAKL